MPYYVMQFIQGLGLDDVLDELKCMQAAGNKGASTTCADRGPSRRDASAADIALSLLSGRFEPAASAEAERGMAVSTRPHDYAAAAPATGRVEQSRASDSFTLSSTSAVLPGPSDISGKGTRKKQTYWQSVARIGVQVGDA